MATAAPLRVAAAALSDPAVVELITFHQRDMLAVSPPGTSFALDVSGLSGPQVTLFGAWDEDELVAIGALKRLGEEQAEIKSMRTWPAHRGRGAARAILEAIVTAARDEGVRRLSLETGTSDEFQPAIALYRSRGFAPGARFGGYENGPHNQCYHLDL